MALARLVAEHDERATCPQSGLHERALHNREGKQRRNRDAFDAVVDDEQLGSPFLGGDGFVRQAIALGEQVTGECRIEMRGVERSNC